MNWIRKIFRKKPSYPSTSHWQEYARLFDQAPLQKGSFRTKRFVVLDTETTGLDPNKAKLLSIGAVAVKNQQIIIEDRFEAFFPNGGFYQGQERESVAVHGILRKHSAHLSDSKNIFIELLAYLQNSIIVGHHIAFDFAMLNNAFQNQLGASLQNQLLDTAHLAKRINSPWQTQALPQQAGQYSLDELCKTYNISIEGRHTASGDALLTSLLFVKLLGRLELRGVKTLNDLLQ